MHLDQTATDRQAEAGAADFSRGGGIDLRELLENVLQLFRRNAESSVFDSDLNSGAVFLGSTDGDFCR